MHSAKHFLAAGLCMAFLAACHAPELPATQPPVTHPAVAQPSATQSPVTHPSITQPSTTLSPENHIHETSSAEITSAEITSPLSTTEEITAAASPPTTKEAIATSSPSATEESITTSPPPATEEVTSTSPPTAEEVTSSSPPTAEEVTSSSAPATTEEITATQEVISTTEPDTMPAPILNRGRAEEAFQIQNQLLSAQDVTPLQWSDALYQIAAQRVQEITSDYSHTGCPDWVAENILMGTDRPDLAVQIWYDSPGHQRNMLAGWTYGAVANYGFYWAAIYAMVEFP